MRSLIALCVTALAAFLLLACESDQSTSRTAVAPGAVGGKIVCPEGVRCDACCDKGCTMTCEETEDGRCLVTCYVDGEKCCSKVIEPGECTIPFGSTAEGCAPCPEE